MVLLKSLIISTRKNCFNFGILITVLLWIRPRIMGTQCWVIFDPQFFQFLPKCINTVPLLKCYFIPVNLIFMLHSLLFKKIFIHFILVWLLQYFKLLKSYIPPVFLLWFQLSREADCAVDICIILEIWELIQPLLQLALEFNSSP